MRERTPYLSGRRSLVCVLALCAAFGSLSIAFSARAADSLSSWNDGSTKQSIVSFVDKVTKRGSPDFVPASERIATFDNDGTLWTEQPMYFQLAFVFDRVKVVGSSGKLKFEMRDGKPVLVKLAEVDLIDDKEGKPVGIQTHIGRRPIAAFGNSDGDLQMLQWTTAGSGPRFALIVHHTDAQREWAYDRTSHIGKLDKALDEGQAKDWTIVDMKRDWKRIYPFEK